LPEGTRRMLNSKTAPMHFPKGTIIHFRAAGGGGYGAPAERDLEAIQADLDDGYVSPTAAHEYYGVTVNHDSNRAEGSWVVVPRQPGLPK
jgi:N-methylhydantoinase B/oxoprolinase/acetone carboxylase alpha subunit